MAEILLGVSGGMMKIETAPGMVPRTARAPASSISTTGDRPAAWMRSISDRSVPYRFPA